MSVYIIAEVGVNHNGDIKIAQKMIDEAKKAGCDCVKFQTFVADNLVTKEAPKAQYQKETTGENETQYEMLKKLELSLEDFRILKEYCDFSQIDFLSTPFDEQSVDILEDLGIDKYKIPSGEITNKPLIEYIAKTKKEILLSTGMSTIDEIQEAMDWIEFYHTNISLFHCTSSYPTPYQDVNMNALITLKKRFDKPIGYSDHTQGIEISLMAVAMGAQLIEKHFTLDRNMEGPDHKASLEPSELKELVDKTRNIEQAFGNDIKQPTEQELQTKLVARKSLVASKTLNIGDVITKLDIVCKRPGIGIPPKFYNEVLGKEVVESITKDSLIEFRKLR